jgi:hypothetical protein
MVFVEQLRARRAPSSWRGPEIRRVFLFGSV